LLAIDPLVELITFRFLEGMFSNFDVLNWIFICLGTPAALLGLAALAAATWLAAQPPAPA
jgi:hypothetical protein